MALGDVIARLSVSLGLETAAFERGSRKAQREVTGLQGHVSKAAKAIGSALAGMVAWETVRVWGDATKAAIDFAGSLGETAQQLGVTTNELQEYRYVASQTGIEQAAMDKALQKTTRTLGELATPTKAQAAAMKELGLSAKDLEGLGTGDFLVLLADKFKGLTAAEQAALGAQLGLGRSFQTLIPLLNEGSVGIEKMRQAAHDLGIVISEEAIKNADANADLLTAYEQIAAAQKNVTLTQPENVRAYMEYRKAVVDLQVGLHKAVADIINFGNAWDQTVRDFGKNTGIQDFFRNVNTTVSAWAKNTHDAIAAIPKYIDDMVARAQRVVDGALAAMWDRAIAKINTVKAAFFNLYDAVVGHSYIPDMVDGIAREMARLDTVMVAQAGKATSATAKKFQDLRDLLDRLFPAVGKANQFNADLAAIEASGLAQAAKDEAVARLWREYSSGSPFGGGGIGEPDFGDAGPIADTDQAMRDLGVTMDAMAKKAGLTTVRVAESFKDMATETIESLGSLAKAIKGGGFLDILSAAVNVGLQLAGAGAFGKGAQAWVNRPAPGFATGTPSAPRGLAWVGERGPELVNFRGGERVHSSRNSMAMAGPRRIEVVPSAYFDVVVDGRIQRAAPAIASAGGQAGVAQMRRLRERELG